MKSRESSGQRALGMCLIIAGFVAAVSTFLGGVNGWGAVHWVGASSAVLSLGLGIWLLRPHRGGKNIHS